MKAWDRAGIELAAPGSAVRHASVARHLTDCATQPGSLNKIYLNISSRRNKQTTIFQDKNNIDRISSLKMII